jgi:hypothetical protein
MSEKKNVLGFVDVVSNHRRRGRKAIRKIRFFLQLAKRETRNAQRNYPRLNCGGMEHKHSLSAFVQL